MTDLSVMLGMLMRSKVEFKTEKVREEYNRDTHSRTSVWRKVGFTIITVERGYERFFSDLIFDDAGKLVTVEAYE